MRGKAVGGSSSVNAMAGLRPLIRISRRLAQFGGVPLTVVMTFPERTHVVLSRSRRDLGSAWFLLVARGMPLGEGVNDDLGPERGHLRKRQLTTHPSRNPTPLARRCS